MCLTILLLQWLKLEHRDIMQVLSIEKLLCIGKTSLGKHVKNVEIYLMSLHVKTVKCLIIGLFALIKKIPMFCMFAFYIEIYDKRIKTLIKTLSARHVRSNSQILS